MPLWIGITEVHTDQTLASRKCRCHRWLLSSCIKHFSYICGTSISGQSDLEFCFKGWCLLNVLIVYSHKVALQIKGKTSLVVQWDMREVGDLEKIIQPPWNSFCALKMQGRLFLSTHRPPVLIGVSMMFAILWSWRVSTDSASASMFELFRAATLLSSCLWDLM